MKIGFCLFTGVTQLDFTGPLQVMHRIPGAEMSLAAPSLDPVVSDCGLALVPTVTYDACPPLDLLCVPGGPGTRDAIQDSSVIQFVRHMGDNASYVCSVCTGAFLLGAAGLLHEKKATTHWAYVELLSLVGAKYTPGRVVRDGRLFTGGGVTAGIDFGLTIAAEVAGERTAKEIQLEIEYTPDPPFAVDPNQLHDEGVNRVKDRYVERVEKMQRVLTNL